MGFTICFAVFQATNSRFFSLFNFVSFACISVEDAYPTSEIHIHESSLILDRVIPPLNYVF